VGARPLTSTDGQNPQDGQNPDGELWSAFRYRLEPLPDGHVQLCAACKLLGHCRLGLTDERLGEGGPGTIRIELTCPADHDAGPGGVAHGGWVASALDETLGHTVILAGHLAVTGTLTVHFLRPAPIERPMIATARVVRRDGLRWHLEGELTLAATGAVIARAEGVWVERTGSHYDRFQAWLATQDAQAAASGDA
jgi:acyl-coenzyme A thioesterase PaaI-like protein